MPDFESEGRGFKSLRVCQLFPENQQLRGMIYPTRFLYFPLFSNFMWHKSGTNMAQVELSFNLNRRTGVLVFNHGIRMAGAV
jgi:hypothetical protein